MANNNDYKVNVSVQFNAIMNDINNAIEQLKQKIQGLTSSGGQKNFFSGVASDVDAIAQRLEKLRNTPITSANFNKFQAELQNINNLINTARENLEKAPKVDFTEKIAEQENKIAKLQEQRANQSGDNAKKIDQQIRGHQLAISNYQKQQEQANNATNAATVAYDNEGRAVDQLDKELQEFITTQRQQANDKVAQSIQTQVSRYIGLAAIYRYTKRYLQDLIATYKEFDESLVAIAAVTGQTRDQMWANISVYNKMAQSLGTTTQEVINASKLYYQQGLTTTSVLKLTEETVKLATIAELDSADATEYLTTAMNGFKLSAEESTRVTDVWANLAAKTASDVDELAIAISKVASLAENAGMEIETASAFLNQMIETTREAPENLGTALKTIIARFQELKSSEEELSDGVDANKVEKALRSAGVALRDASGQFRDFDDVILELSSKWDGLDRNTQRYIATIAAGSRQQSRFIALVSDYEGLLRNVNYAYDSLGSADAQMAVFQEGLTASTNRLQAAWEGLYTSWSESATVISKLIDGMATLVSTLADLGAGWSGLIAVVGALTVAILANAAAQALHVREQFHEITVKKGLINAYKQLIVAQIESLKITLATIAPYVAIAAAIMVVVGAIVALATAEERHIRALEKEATQLRQTAAQEKDKASNLGVLITEIEDTAKAGEDLADVRQKILDQFGDEIDAIALEGKTAEELIEILEALRAEKERQAAEDYNKSYITDRELDIAKKEQEYRDKDHKVYSKDKYQYDKNGDAIWEDEAQTIQAVKTVWYIDDKEYEDYDAYVRDLYTLLGKSLPKNYSDDIAAFNAKAFIDSGEIEKETQYSEKIVENFYKSLSNEQRTNFLKDGIFNPDDVKTINQINEAINSLTNSIKEGSEEEKQFSNFLSGNFNQLTINQIEQYKNTLKGALGDDLYNSLFSAGEEAAQNYIEGIKARWANTGISENLKQQAQNWVLNLQTAFLNKFEESSSTEREMAVRWVNNFQEGVGEALSSLDADEIWEKYLDVVIEAGDDGVSDELKDAFANLLDFSDLSFDHPVEQIQSLSGALQQLHDATEGIDIGSFTNLIYELADASDAATIATITQGMTIDATTGKVQLSEEATKDLAMAKIQQAIAEMQAGLAAAEEQKAIIEGAIAIRKSRQASINLGAANTGMAADTATAAQAWAMLNAALKSDNPDAVLSQIYALQNGVQGLTSEAIRLASSGFTDEDLEGQLQKADALVNMYKAGISSLENINLDSYLSNIKKSGSGTSKADKASKDYLNTLKKLAKQLKDTANEAEAAAKREIAAILAVLEAQKDALQQRQDELEKSRDKQSKELSLWVKAQIEILEKLQDAREKAFEDEEESLELQAEAAENVYDQQIQAIQDLIDAIDDEAEAEDRLLKLQKARDDYNKAQSSRTRLVLTKGAGWIFKTEQNEITKARDSLRQAEREYQKSVLEDQKKQLEEQADKWKDIASGIKKSASEIEKLNNAIEKFFNNVDGYADINAYEAAVTAHQAGRDQINFDQDENAEGSIAYQIAKLNESLDQIERSFEEQLEAETYEEILKIVQNSDDTKGLIDTTNDILNNVLDYMTRFSQAAKEYANNNLKIEDLDETIEIWKNIDENIGLTTSEIAEAEKLYKKYNDSFEKKGIAAFAETSAYYKQMLSRLDEVASLFQKAKEAQDRVDTYEEATQGGFSTGGVVDFYGPADLHGTIAEPEVVFNARQASALFNWVKSLSGFGIPQINGVNPTPTSVVNNTSRLSNDIYINELNVNSSADNFDSLVVDIRRYSPIANNV